MLALWLGMPEDREMRTETENLASGTRQASPMCRGPPTRVHPGHWDATPGTVGPTALPGRLAREMASGCWGSMAGSTDHNPMAGSPIQGRSAEPGPTPPAGS